MRKKLHHIATALGLDVGCGDNSCIWGPPGGMATNGGCRCYGSRGDRNGGGDRITLLQMAQVARHLLDVYNVQTTPTDKRKCEACGKMSRVTTAGCDHCDFEDK